MKQTRQWDGLLSLELLLLLGLLCLCDPLIAFNGH
jgi:hypothetical protein